MSCDSLKLRRAASRRLIEDRFNRLISILKSPLGLHPTMKPNYVFGVPPNILGTPFRYSASTLALLRLLAANNAKHTPQPVAGLIPHPNSPHSLHQLLAYFYIILRLLHQKSEPKSVQTMKIPIPR
jgi:hypothetical protein